MAENTIDSLSIQLNADATNASKGIESLVSTLNSLRSATKGGLGLTAVSKQLDSVATASNKIDSSAISNISSLADAISKLHGLKLSSTIGTQIKSIGEAVQGLGSVDMGGVSTKMSELTKALAPLAEIQKSNLGSALSQLKKLPEVFKGLQDIDMGAFSAKIKEVADAMKPLADEMQKVANGFSAFPSKLQKFMTSVNGVSSGTNRMSRSAVSSSLSFMGMISKIGIAYMSVKRIGSIIGSLIKKSSEYNETVNLFNVSMGKYAVEAKKYIDSVSEIMGIDPAEWMRNQGIFMTLAKGFGVVGDRAYTMSQQLTQLGYDLASFYNTDVEEAMVKIQSGMAGELEPLRRWGYDLSQAKLEATALSLGIDKAVSSMTQAEKAELRYYAIMTQLTWTHGDMARTLEEPANQLRIFTAQLNMAGRAIGSIFIPALNKILPYAIAVVKVIRILAETIAKLFNYELPEVTFDDESSGASSIAESMEDASESAKKMKNYMMGFDELNVIDTSSGSGSNGENPLGGGFGFDLPTYDFIGEATEGRVSEIVGKMREWLGITGEITSWADLFDTRLGKILITVGLIGAGIALWKIGTGIYTFFTTIVTTISGIATTISGVFGAISTAITTFATGIGVSAGTVVAVGALIVIAIASIVAGLVSVYKNNEDVRNSVNTAIDNLKSSFVPLAEYITNTVLPDLKQAWNTLVEVLTPLGDWLSMVFTSVWEDMIIPAMNYMGDTVIPLVTTCFKNLWEKVLKPLGDFLASVFKPIIEKLSTVLTWLWEYVVLPLADCIGGVFSSAFEGIATIFNEVVVPRVNELIGVLQFLWNNVFSPIVDFLWDIFAPAFETVFQSIKTIIGNIKKVFQGVIDFVVGIFTKDWEKAWNGVKSIFSGVWDTFSTILKTPLNMALSQIEAFINKIIDGWNSLKRKINTLSIDIPDWLGGGKFGLDLAMSDKISIPRFADGGFPDVGQMFVAREAGAEMVGSIGRRTAVANNEQIVAGIASGVAEANGEQNDLLREQNTLLRALLEKETGVYLDGRSLTNSVEKYQRERGRTILSGGVA